MASIQENPTEIGMVGQSALYHCSVMAYVSIAVKNLLLM